MYFTFYRFRIYQQAKIELFIFDITRFCQYPSLTQVKFGQNASELPFACLERVLAVNVSHENGSIFTPMNVHIFSYKWFRTKTRFARGKSKLGIGLFIHELLREPLICVWIIQQKVTSHPAKKPA